MPTYEYECTQCGEQFQREEHIEEHEQTKRVKCPQCGSTKVEQLIAPVYVHTAKKS